MSRGSQGECSRLYLLDVCGLCVPMRAGDGQGRSGSLHALPHAQGSAGTPTHPQLSLTPLPGPSLAEEA